MGLDPSHVSHVMGAFGLEANLTSEVLSLLTMNLYVAYTASNHIRNTSNKIGDYFSFGKQAMRGALRGHPSVKLLNWLYSPDAFG